MSESPTGTYKIQPILPITVPVLRVDSGRHLTIEQELQIYKIDYARLMEENRMLVERLARVNLQKQAL